MRAVRSLTAVWSREIAPACVTPSARRVLPPKTPFRLRPVAVGLTRERRKLTTTLPLGGNFLSARLTRSRCRSTLVRTLLLARPLAQPPTRRTSLPADPTPASLVPPAWRTTTSFRSCVRRRFSAHLPLQVSAVRTTLDCQWLQQEPPLGIRHLPFQRRTLLSVWRCRYPTEAWAPSLRVLVSYSILSAGSCSGIRRAEELSSRSTSPLALEGCT